MRLIDADALKLSHCKECTLYPNKCMGKDCDWHAIIHINEMPTIDAVPVIRCKDCRWWWEGMRVCALKEHLVDGVCAVLCMEDDFCSRAEPKRNTKL